MKINKWVPLLAPLLLTGCLSTPNEARNTSALYSGSSAKVPEKLANCIYEGWTNNRVMLERDNTTHTEITGDKITVFTWKDTMFADVYKKGSGSETKFYKTFAMGYPLAENRREIVEGCL